MIIEFERLRQRGFSVHVDETSVDIVPEHENNQFAKDLQELLVSLGLKERAIEEILDRTINLTVLHQVIGCIEDSML